MTQQHPITPPPELITEWINDYFGCSVTGGLSDVETAIATSAAQWGADQELEACCHEVQNMYSGGHRLRAVRRPKPLTLKEQALAILNDAHRGDLGDDEMATIRRALEQLPDNE